MIFSLFCVFFICEIELRVLYSHRTTFEFKNMEDL